MPRKRLQGRLLLLGMLWLAGFCLISARLFVVQVLEHEKYVEIGRKHFENRRELPAQRGAILDRNGEKLAVDLIHYSLAVKPELLVDKNKTVRQIADALKIPMKKIIQKIGKNRRFVYLTHRLTPEIASRLKALQVPGVILEKKFSRYYPFKEKGAHVLGFCDYYNQARSGLELEYDAYLKGKPGWMVFLRDALGNQFPNLDYPASEPIDGMNVISTIDIVYQNIIEEELRQTVKAHQASQGAAVLLDPQTGEILTLANHPGFDPNRYSHYPVQNYRNVAISNLYEPGSTFKIIALALALEQLKLNLDQEKIYCEQGTFHLFKNVIHDHKAFGYLSLREVFEKSSNIGVVKLARRFEAPIFYRYARDFGFGTLTDIDLPAESSGILHKPSEYSRYSLYYMSIGYEVAVTPLQVACAYAVIANGGKLMRPFVVSKILDADGQPILQNKPEVIRQVLSPLTARYMRETLQGVVIEGTGKNAFIRGVAVAGKTGTSQKIDVETNRYTSKKHVASFVGFFPVEHPRFVLLIVVNNPRKGYYGSDVAAPAFRNIAMRLVGLPDVRVSEVPNIKLVEGTSENHYIPAVEGLDLFTAINLLERNAIPYEVVGKGHRVYHQFPPPQGDLPPTTKVKLITYADKELSEQVMPELTGLTLKEALQELSGLNVIPEVEGHGIVVKQVPVAGNRLKEYSKIKLVCKPT